jgi:hypothetical protein
MAAVNVTNSADDDTVLYTGQCTVRNSSGTPYVVVVNQDGPSVEVWKGNSTTPTSFSEQDSGNKPSKTGISVAAAAIDTFDNLRIVYWSNDTSMGGSGGLWYVVFDADGSTDTFSGDTKLVAIDDGTSAPSVDVALDSSRDAHIVYIDGSTNMGASYRTVYFVFYDVSLGSASSAVEVYGVTAKRNSDFPEVEANASDKAVISYIFYDP